MKINTLPKSKQHLLLKDSFRQAKERMISGEREKFGIPVEEAPAQVKEAESEIETKQYIK